MSRIPSNCRYPLVTLKILFDHGTPAPLRRSLSSHQVTTAAENGWDSLTNGELLANAEHEGHDVLVTTDQNMRYQQNLGGRQLAIVVLLSTAWPYLSMKIEEIRSAIEGVSSREFIEVPI